MCQLSLLSWDLMIGFVFDTQLNNLVRGEGYKYETSKKNYIINDTLNYIVERCTKNT